MKSKKLLIPLKTGTDLTIVSYVMPSNKKVARNVFLNGSEIDSSLEKLSPNYRHIYGVIGGTIGLTKEQFNAIQAMETELIKTCK